MQEKEIKAHIISNAEGNENTEVLESDALIEILWTKRQREQCLA